MLKILISPQAIEDLEQIFDYTVKSWSFNQAEKYQDDFFESFNSISKNPSLGEVYYFKTGNYRKLKMNRHLIFYNCNKEEYVIMRILHEQMDLRNHLKY